MAAPSGSCLALLVLCCLHCAASALSLHSLAFWRSRGKPKPPAFPDSFEASYTFTLPYVQTVQTLGLSFPVRVWYDGHSQRLRTDVYGGLDSTLTADDDTYLIYPRIDKKVCEVHHDDVGPTATGLLSSRLLAAAPLPDISDWHYGGVTRLGNAEVHIWQLFERQAGKTSTYTFYTTPEGLPVRFYMMGYNVLQGSHFDEYLVDFTAFKPGPIKGAVFEAPPLCAGSKQQQADNAATRHAAQALSASAALMPWGRVNALSSTSTSGGGGGGDASSVNAAELQQLRRLAVRAENARFVGEWNAAAASSSRNGGAGFQLALNRFADALPEEYALLASAKRSSPASELVKQTRSLGVVAPPPGLTKRHLPRHVSWRGTPADNVVKDQATCGSCWAFSAVGAMQGAWYLATDEVLSLSEQQLVDCSWKYGNNGCQGGEMEPAIQYVVDAKGAASEEDYQYAGQNMFCGKNATRADFAPVAHFKGFANVKRRDETALMYALWRHGPVAISIDASQPTFKFYSEGVYRDSGCKIGQDEMDHAVLLVGYGTDEATGEDYWLVKTRGQSTGVRTATCAWRAQRGTTTPTAALPRAPCWRSWRRSTCARASQTWRRSWQRAAARRPWCERHSGSPAAHEGCVFVFTTAILLPAFLQRAGDAPTARA